MEETGCLEQDCLVTTGTAKKRTLDHERPSVCWEKQPRIGTRTVVPIETAQHHALASKKLGGGKGGSDRNSQLNKKHRKFEERAAEVSRFHLQNFSEFFSSYFFITPFFFRTVCTHNIRVSSFSCYHNANSSFVIFCKCHSFFYC